MCKRECVCAVCEHVEAKEGIRSPRHKQLWTPPPPPTWVLRIGQVLLTAEPDIFLVPTVCFLRFPFLKVCWGAVYGPQYALFWQLFYILLVETFFKCQLDSVDWWCFFSSTVSLMIFTLLDLPITERGTLNSLIRMMGSFISLWSTIWFRLMCVDDGLLAHTH